MGPGTSDQSLFRLWHKFTKISSLVIYYLTKFYDVIIKWCSSYSKNYTWKFMQANSWHHKLFLLHFSFWIRRVCKGRGKITKSWISPEQKEIFKLNKTFFSFWIEGFSLGSGIPELENRAKKPSYALWCHKTKLSNQIVTW